MVELLQNESADHLKASNAAERILEAFRKGSSPAPDVISRLKNQLEVTAGIALDRAKAIDLTPAFDTQATQDSFSRFLHENGVEISRLSKQSLEQPKARKTEAENEALVAPSEEAPQLHARVPARSDISEIAPVNRQVKTRSKVMPPKQVSKRETARAEREKGRPRVNGYLLPRNVKSVEETVTMKHIVCLEDGKRVKDLAAHLKEHNMTPDEYREKWSLGVSYPMLAPQTILQKGPSFEIDVRTGNVYRVWA